MDTEASVTEWIELARKGDQEGAQKLYDRYVRQLIPLARHWLKARRAPRRAADEEDVVQSLFQSFFQRLQADQFPRLNDRDSLWPMLVTIARRKASNQLRHARALKRGGGAPSPPPRPPSPSPEDLVALAEEIDRLLSTLDGTELQIVRFKEEELEDRVIAEKLDCGVRTVERKWAAIKAKLQENAT